MKKEFTLVREQNGRKRTTTDTLENLIQAHSYTLESGRCYQHEKGNKKINTEPKSISSLVSNLNNAVNNSASNGYSGVYYSVLN